MIVSDRWGCELQTAAGYSITEPCAAKHPRLHRGFHLLTVTLRSGSFVLIQVWLYSTSWTGRPHLTLYRTVSGVWGSSAVRFHCCPPASNTHTCRPAVPGRLSSHVPSIRLPLPAPLCTHRVDLGLAAIAHQPANASWPFVCSAPAVLSALHCADTHLLSSAWLRNSAIRMTNFTGILPKIRLVYRCVK